MYTDAKKMVQKTFAADNVNKNNMWRLIFCPSPSLRNEKYCLILLKTRRSFQVRSKQFKSELFGCHVEFVWQVQQRRRCRYLAARGAIVLLLLPCGKIPESFEIGQKNKASVNLLKNIFRISIFAPSRKCCIHAIFKSWPLPFSRTNKIKEIQQKVNPKKLKDS